MGGPTISRAQIAPVQLPELRLEVPAVGGVLCVRGLTLPQVLQFATARRQAMAPRDGEDDAATAQRASGELVPLLLHQAVVLDDGLPVYSVAEWAAFAVQHPEPTRELWDAALRLSGQDADAEKKA